MAVVGMKLLSVVGPLERFDEVTRGALIGNGFHPEDVSIIAKKVKELRRFAFDNPYAALLTQAGAILDLLEITPEYTPFDARKDPDKRESAEYLDSLEKGIRERIDRRDELRDKIHEDENIAVQLAHYGDVSVRLEDLFHFSYAQFRFGCMPKDTYRHFAAHLEDDDSFYFFPSVSEGENVYGMYMAPRNVIEKVDTLFASLHFERIRITDDGIAGTPAEAEALVKERIRAETQESERAAKELSEIAARERERLLALYCDLKYLNDSFEIRRYAAHTDNSFYIIGWVPEAEADAIMKRLDEMARVTYTIDDPEGLVDFSPPIKLKNKKLFAPFETLLGMYGLPSYNEIDPTPLIAVVFTLLFGIMFGDIGQGIVLLIAGILMWKLKKIPLGKVICYAGVSATAFGFVYGSVFGNEHLLPGFKAMENGNTINTILLTGVGLGVALIFVAMAYNIANGVRQKDPGKVFFSQNGIAGAVLYAVLLALVLSMFVSGLDFINMKVLVWIVVVTSVIILLKEPLSHLAQRRADWMPKNKAEFLIESLIELFDVFLSYLSNTISFVRIGIFALNHAGMMMVVYLLARTASGSDNILVVILGNAFVMVLEGLIVGIQVMRLEFFELFSRFYSGSGTPYQPFEIHYSKNTTGGKQ